MSALVTCIMPTANRPHLVEWAIYYYERQTYPNKELVICYDKLSDLPEYTGDAILVQNTKLAPLGEKRNIAINAGSGDIILHIDDDDWYAPDWVVKSVASLGKADMTGLGNGYFYMPHIALRIYSAKNPNFIFGATMCYKRSFWEQNKFFNQGEGEDNSFMSRCKNIKQHDYLNGFMCIIHGRNTSSDRAFKKMSGVNLGKAKEILGSDYENYM